MKYEFQMSCAGPGERRPMRTLRGARFVLPFALCFLPFALSPAACLPAQAQQLVDQVISRVNDDIIARTDLLWSLALDPKAPSPSGPVSPDLLRQKLDVMIDQRLIAQEAGRVPTASVTQDEIDARRTALIKQFKSEAEFRQRVESVGLTPQRIDELIREMIFIERFIDFRFRSSIFIPETDVQRYYDGKLAPEVRKGGQVPPSLDDTIEGVTVRESINKILKQEKINEEIEKWLRVTRERADIEYLAEL